MNCGVIQRGTLQQRIAAAFLVDFLFLHSSHSPLDVCWHTRTSLQHGLAQRHGRRRQRRGLCGCAVSCIASLSNRSRFRARSCQNFIQGVSHLLNGKKHPGALEKF